MRALVVATVLAGCYSPHPQAGTPCPTGACPDPLVCSPATRTCETTAVDAATSHDAPATDAAPDAPPIDAPRTAMLVQQATNHVDGDAVTISLASAPTAGDVLLLVGADIHRGLPSVGGVTGGGVATWSRAAFSAVNTNVEIWWGVTDGSSTDVTIHGIAGDTSAKFGNVSEWSGLVTQAPVDGAHALDGISSPADPGAMTTANAHDLLVFGVGDGAPNTFGVPAPGTWTALTPISADISLAAWYRIQTVAGTVHPTVTETSGQWDAAVAAFTIAP